MTDSFFLLIKWKRMLKLAASLGGSNMVKLNEMRDYVNQKQLDVAYISNFEDIKYFTGFGSDPVERVLALFIFPDAEPFLFAPELEVEAIKESGWKYPVYGYLDHEDPFKLIAKHIRDVNPDPKRFGIEDDNLVISRYQQLQAEFPKADFKTNVAPKVSELRVIKTPYEIEQLDAAGKEADFAFKVGLETAKAGKTEAEVAAEIEYQEKIRGVMNMSFDTLVQTGPHAAEPHGATDMNQIKNDNLLLFDLGTVHNGYISDASRTVAVGDKIPAKQKEIYDVVLEAQLAAQSAAKPGIRAEELDAIARNIIDKAGYGKYFIHRLGHGMGMSEHEFPSIMEGNQMVLKEGMCFSIEPGIYIPGVAGVRIEDCIHLTKDGNEPFTHTSKELRYV